MKKATFLLVAALVVCCAAASFPRGAALDDVGVGLTRSDMAFTVGQSGCPPTSGSRQVGGACNLAAVAAPSCTSHWLCCCNPWTPGNSACPGENTYVASGSGTATFTNTGCSNTYTQYNCVCQGFLLLCYPGSTTLTCPGNKQLLGSSC